MFRTYLACTLVMFPAFAYADEQDEAIAHVVNLRGRLDRDETKPGRPVVGVSLAGAQKMQIDIKKLAAFPELKNLSLANTGVTDSQVTEVANLKSLTELDLSGAQITGYTFQQLAATKIEKLKLGSAILGDEDLKDLAGMKSLKSVDVSFIKLTEKCVVHLAAIPNLEDLDLAGIPVTDNGMKVFSAAKMLKSLKL